MGQSKRPGDMEGEWNMLIQGATKYKSEMATEEGLIASWFEL
jgi:hypothetical protein